MTHDAAVLYGVLRAFASLRITTTYGAVAKLIGVHLDHGRGEQARLGRLLNEVADYTLDEFGVVLPAIVVGKRDGVPSGKHDPLAPRSGFYAWCESKGIDISDPVALVHEQQRKVFNAFAAA